MRTLCFVLAFAAIHMDSPQSTIAQLAARHPGEPLTKIRVRELREIPFHEVVAGADVVVDATVTSTRSYLSPDEQDILTDYQFSPREVIAGRLPMVSPQPGEVQLPSFTLYGGSLTLHGVRVDMRDENMPASIGAGTRLLLFLRRTPDSRRYEVVGEIVGILSLADDRVTPLMRPAIALERFRGWHRGDFIKEILQVGARR